MDGVDDELLIEMLRERELHEDAVDRLIRVELGDFRKERLHRGLRGEPVNLALEPILFGRALFISHVDLRGGIVPNEDDMKAGAAAMRGEEARGALPHATAKSFSEVFP